MNQEQTLETLSSIRDYVRWGASRFAEADLCFGHGTDNALDESWALVCHALSLEPGLPDSYLSAVLTPQERRAVLDLLERRVDERVPAAYLTGRTWFAGLEFRVDPRVLVPRSPMAELVVGGLQPWLVPDSAPRVLDLCTGSGCIAVACAHYLVESRVDAADLSADALEVARKNVDLHGLQERVRVIESDLFDALTGQVYDLVISNPPYVPDAVVGSLPDEYRQEPVMGLVAGEDGLDIVLRLLAAAGDHLAGNGLLVVEVGDSEPTLQALLPGVPFLWLDFEHGGHGVFLLAAAQVRECREQFEAVLRARRQEKGVAEVSG